VTRELVVVEGTTSQPAEKILSSGGRSFSSDMKPLANNGALALEALLCTFSATSSVVPQTKTPPRF
jgi:hypothetical protein